VTLLGLVLGWIPVAGQVLALLLGWALGMLLVCLDAFDPPLERRKLSFRRKLGVVRANGAFCLGFGAPAAVLTGVPFLNLLMLPLVMVAGTLFYCEQLHDDLA
jgi:CysZ protein